MLVRAQDSLHNNCLLFSCQMCSLNGKDPKKSPQQGFKRAKVLPIELEKTNKQSPTLCNQVN